jgi:hypothetical protein
MDHPSANRLIRDDDAALRKKVLDIPEADRESQIQPDGVLDDSRRKPVAAVAEYLHRQMLPAVMPSAKEAGRCDKPLGPANGRAHASVSTSPGQQPHSDLE